MPHSDCKFPFCVCSQGALCSSTVTMFNQAVNQIPKLKGKDLIEWQTKSKMGQDTTGKPASERQLHKLAARINLRRHNG